MFGAMTDNDLNMSRETEKKISYREKLLHLSLHNGS
jgi:hypothetical protein